MEKAVADAYAKGYLGKNIFGSETEFEIITQTGAGAYEVGEESALMNRSKVSVAFRGSSLPSLLLLVSTADLPSLIMLRPLPPFLT